MESAQLAETTTQICTILGSVVTSILAWKQKRGTRVTKQMRKMFWVTVFTVLVASGSLILFGLRGQGELAYRRMITKLADAGRKLAIDADLEAKSDKAWEENGDKASNEAVEESVPGATVAQGVGALSRGEVANVLPVELA